VLFVVWKFVSDGTGRDSGPGRRGAAPCEDHVKRVNDSRNETEDGQHDVQPEMESEADLQSHTEWRQDDGGDDSEDIFGAFFHDLFEVGWMIDQ